MAYIITEPCIGTKDSACVDVCPVDCIHPRKDEGDFEGQTQLGLALFELAAPLKSSIARWRLPASFAMEPR